MEIYVYGLFLTGYLILGFLSREESGGLFEKMARYIRRKTQERSRRKKRIRISDESAVRREISLLKPLDRTQTGVEQFYVERIRLVLLIFLAGDILAAASYAAAGSNMLLKEENRLVREGIGGEDKNTELEVYLEPEREEVQGEQQTKRTLLGNYQLEVRSRKYSDEKLENLAENLFEKLPGMILDTNEDLSHV